MIARRSLQHFCSSQTPRASTILSQQHENDIKPENLDRRIVPETSHLKTKYALYQIISCPLNFITNNKQIFHSRAFISLFANTLPKEQAKTEEYFVPPKIHENSVFVYQSRNLANSMRALRSSEIAVAGTIALFAKNPIFWVPFMGFGYYCWFNAYFFEASRRMVVRMDILPHLEMLSMQKIGAFGQVYNKLVKITDLEKLDFEIEKNRENYFWMFHKNTMDTHLIFKDKSTGEIFLFDKKGVWDHAGMSHPLIF